MEQTVRLYKQDVDIREWQAQIADVTSIEGNTAVALDRTAFFPVGGGQPWDLGTIDGVHLKAVVEQEGIVYHLLDGQPNQKQFSPGQTVDCELDWDRRFLHMQQHCGEHILSGVFFREYGGVNCGFHMGQDYMTIDVDLEDSQEYSKLTWDMAKRVELLANQVIWSNAPVTVRFYKTREEAANLPLRKPLAVDDNISIVSVGDPDDPADCVACCGTHPKFAGQVGLVKIWRLESYKGMTRVYCQAGSQALADYGLKHDLVMALCGKYSADPSTLLEKIKIQDDKNAVVRTALYKLKKAEMRRIEDEIAAVLSTDEGQATFPPKARRLSPKVTVRECPNLSLDDIQTMGRQLTDGLKGLLLLIAPEENTVMLFSSGTPDCGRLVKENAPIYQGKGGGNNVSARAIFNSRDHLDTYIDLLEKHLR